MQTVEELVQRSPPKEAGPARPARDPRRCSCQEVEPSWPARAHPAWKKSSKGDEGD
jgi:hypothetical protein